MTEAEWLACIKPGWMIGFLSRKPRQRKLRLFAVACARRVAHLLSEKRSLAAIDISEQHADGLATEEEKNQAGHDGYNAAASVVASPSSSHAQQHAASAAYHAVYYDDENDVQRVVADVVAALIASEPTSEREEWLAYCALLRCIFGNPFRPVPLDRSWRTLKVTSLAQAIYDDSAFDRLPILADAMEDAGCMDADVLDHCRGAGEHVRGCWVVDLVLGKE
ncbi:hypothetical protein AYO44_09220 [Planctomycetaceae bacterium SCGC AG-212-F19]|nr:hypothetical protein AYO44_09220 [Planctomycetaceae bacterium SCGC AG-212-F19]